ncbi:hypothetical protein ZWY2020_035599 [Hordeum vulgare]|nr:hypothetical protein ZWY2020_035599 [Hordeum vulgare]
MRTWIFRPRRRRKSDEDPEHFMPPGFGPVPGLDSPPPVVEAGAPLTAAPFAFDLNVEVEPEDEETDAHLRACRRLSCPSKTAAAAEAAPPRRRRPRAKAATSRGRRGCPASAVPPRLHAPPVPGRGGSPPGGARLRLRPRRPPRHALPPVHRRPPRPPLPARARNAGRAGRACADPGPRPAGWPRGRGHRRRRQDRARVPAGVGWQRGALLESPKWLVYCNGRRVGFAVRRETMSDGEGWAMEKLWAVTAGAGRLPGGGVEYLRGQFERIVGSADAASFHLVEPLGWLGAHGDGGLSVFFHRI